jgi:hypothetical protein
MIDLMPLHQQIHKITETSNVFLYLAKNRSLCDTETACELFFNYVEQVREHLTQVDYLVKKHLLNNSRPWAKNLAYKLIADSSLLQRNFTTYLARWTGSRRAEIRIADHTDFVHDSEELFTLILDRAQRETEYLFPLLRQINNSDEVAA